MQRSTKIVATLGPASSSADVLTRMLAAGVDVMRLNFSHGTAADHEERARMVREAARSLGREVAIMADLQGPKIRIGKFASGKVVLKAGQQFTLDAARELGDEAAVGKEHLTRATVDYFPSRDLELLDYMELLAVFEASSRRLLPPKYASMQPEELDERLRRLRVVVGNRR